MNRKYRVLFLSIAMLLVLALPITALASPTKWIAQLSFRNELHTVVGSQAGGTAAIRSGASSYDFSMTVLGLSGPAVAAHIHGPADATQTAGVLITLCGGSAPACPALNDQGRFVLNGSITGPMLQNAGLTAPQFISYLNDGLLYVNVHTSLNPAGEARGNFTPFNP